MKVRLTNPRLARLINQKPLEPQPEPLVGAKIYTFPYEYSDYLLESLEAELLRVQKLLDQSNRRVKFYRNLGIWCGGLGIFGTLLALWLEWTK